jgi:1-deoxy-D-xylulose-5-phosphate synthase
MDRAGVAGEDGPTHHGAFDIAYMLAIPGMTVTAPKDGAELLALLRLGVSLSDGPFSIRWPRASVPTEVPALAEIPEVIHPTWEILREGTDVAILAVGPMVGSSLKAAEDLAKEGVSVTVVNCRFLKPYDRKALASILGRHKAVATVEEGTVVNGFGAFLSREIADDPDLEMPDRFATLGLPDEFVTHGSRGTILGELGLDPAGIAARVKGLVAIGPRASRESA